MHRTHLFGAALLLATAVQLWITTRVGGYEWQVLSALVTVGLALATAVTFFRSLDGVAGDG